MRLFLKLFVSGIFAILFLRNPVYAGLPILAESAALIDEATGALLYSNNPHEIMYPAGLTKILTAILVIEYLDLNEIIVIGNEVLTTPGGSIIAGHLIGEHITVANLLRTLIIGNANDSGIVLSLAVARAQRGVYDIPFEGAQTVFANLMNARALEIGALYTNFVNPNGLHHDNHVSTAYDLALISREFLSYPFLRELAAQSYWTGNGLDGADPAAIEALDAPVRTVDYNIINSNALVSDGDFNYSYATGIRSGSTPQSGDNVVASATKGEVSLVAVALNSPDPGRWLDVINLFEHGFLNYDYRTLLEEGQLLRTVSVANVVIGAETSLDILVEEGFRLLLNEAEVARATIELVLDEAFKPSEEFLAETESENEEKSELIAPIFEGDAIGRVVISLDGRVLFSTNALAARDIEARSLDSDMDFYLALIIERAFSPEAVPYWIAGGGALIGIIGIILAIKERRKRKKRSWTMLR